MRPLGHLGVGVKRKEISEHNERVYNKLIEETGFTYEMFMEKSV